MNNPAWIVLLVCILSSCSSSNFKQSLAINKSTNQFNDTVDDIVINKMNQYNIPGLAIGIVRDDSIQYTKGYGVTDIDQNKLVDENSAFHTASISKIFTAMAIMDLVDEDKLSLDDKLTDLLPDLKYKNDGGSAIHIKNLLNHTSGLPDLKAYHWRRNNQSDSSLREYLLNYTLKLSADPNTRYGYSNLGYDLLGLVIETVSKMTFDDYMKEKVLDRYDMYSSDFRYYEIKGNLRTAPHSKRLLGKNVQKRKVYPYTREHAPSSTLNASVLDLSKWMVSFLQFTENHKDNHVYASMIAPSTSLYPYIGLGFQLNAIQGFKTVGHYGGDKGFRSYLLMIPEKKIGLVLLANADYNEDFRQEILHAVAMEMLSMD